MTSRIFTAAICCLISLGCASASRQPRGPEVTLDRYFAPVSSAVVSKVPPCQSLEKCGSAPVGTEWKCARGDCWLSPRPVEVAAPEPTPTPEPTPAAEPEVVSPLPDLAPLPGAPTATPAPVATPDTAADRPVSPSAIAPPSQQAESEAAPYPMDGQVRPL